MFNKPKWQRVKITSNGFDTIVSNKDLTKAVQILDDATCHGFHFRIHNGSLEYTEDNIEQEFVHNLLTINITDKP